MLAVLGPHRFDVTHDAVVLVTATAGEHDPATEAASWSGRPDAVLLRAGADASATGSAVAAWRAAVDLPVVVETSWAEVAAAAFEAGAAAARDPSGLSDPGYLDAVVDAGASLVLGCPAEPPIDADGRGAQLVALAEGSGLEPERVVLDVTRGPSVAPGDVRFLGELTVAAATGRPVMVSVEGPAGIDVAAAHAFVLPRGARFVPSRDVRTTRRVARVVAELLRARARAAVAP